jgi:hypothetical protein
MNQYPPVATTGKSHVGRGCIALAKDDKAMRCKTPGKRIGLEDRRAHTELYNKPREESNIVRLRIFNSGGWESEEEKPAQRRKVGNIV